MNASMRDAFLDELYDIAREDRRLIFISNDFGAPSLDKFRADLPDQFVHIGIAEQNMVDVAAGLAMAGKIVYMYSIAPFLPLRCFEQIRVHLGMKGFHITGVMVGAGYSYDLSGPTHQALEDIAVMNSVPGMTILNASDSLMGAAFARMTFAEPGPKYVRFDREKLPPLYKKGQGFSSGIGVLKKGTDLTIAATGIMTHRALEVADKLAGHSVDAGVVDIYRIKPLNEDLLLEAAGGSGKMLTIEESFVGSGIGSIVSGVVTGREADIKLKSIGIPDRFISQGGDRANLQRLCGLDAESVTRTALEWLSKTRR